MIIDANEIESGSIVECDLCIIGAGAAGITLARTFNGLGLKVWLLESGSFDYEQETQDLYRGTSSGRKYFPLDRTRLRYLGGTTNHWSGMCRPLDAIDFQAREWVPDSGWPFDKNHLMPWYQKAQGVCQLGEFNYTAASWLTAEANPTAFDGGGIKARVYQASPPTRFGKVYREELKKSQNVTLCLHANVTQLQAENPSVRLRNLRIQTLAGNEFSIQPQITILASGSIENARLLLASNDVESNGLGNRHDLVGRYFMDHLVIAQGGALLTNARRVPADWYEARHKGRRRLPFPVLLLDNELQRREAIGNYSVYLLKKPEILPPGIRSYQYLEDHLSQDREISHLGEHLGNIIKGISDVAPMLYTRYFGDADRPVEPVTYQQWEHSPNPDSRVRLTAERDSLGMPRVEVDWRLQELDRHTLVAGQQALAREVGRLGIGRLRIDTDASEALPVSVRGDQHQLGTTRMHDSPRHGVVDTDCRVHGMDNLYIAGASVFPTCGSSNPTLTVVALALRLADHIKGRMA